MCSNMADFWRTNQTLFIYSVCIIETDLYLHVTFDVKATSSKSSIGKYYFFKSKYLILRNKKVLFLQKKKELSFFQRESSIILKKNILALRNESIIFVESIIFLKKVLFFSESITFLKKVFWHPIHLCPSKNSDGVLLLLHIFILQGRKNIAIEHVYMSPDVNSNRFEMSFRLHGNLHGDFTAVTFQTIARLYCTCANDIF